MAEFKFPTGLTTGVELVTATPTFAPFTDHHVLVIHLCNGPAVVKVRDPRRVRGRLYIKRHQTASFDFSPGEVESQGLETPRCYISGFINLDRTFLLRILLECVLDAVDLKETAAGSNQSATASLINTVYASGVLDVTHNGLPNPTNIPLRPHGSPTCTAITDFWGRMLP
jgi:hypothetical protein